MYAQKWHWLDYDPVAVAVLVIGLGVIELLAMMIWPHWIKYIGQEEIGRLTQPAGDEPFGRRGEPFARSAALSA
jgi:hypothetical protein